MLGGAVGPVSGDDVEFTRLARAVLRGSILLPGTHGERCLGEKGETWPFPGSVCWCLGCCWRMCGDSTEAIWGCKQSTWEVCSRFILLLRETQPLLRRGVSSRMVLGNVLVLKVKTSGAAPL